MEQSFYTRPREKLRDRGAASLSNSELLQVVIGSGSQTVSAARIARYVGAALDGDASLNYDQLMAITGIGHAKACQLLAALELGARYGTYASRPISGDSLQIPKLGKATGLYYATLTGAQSYIKQRASVQDNGVITEAAIRKMFAYAFHDNAHSLEVTIGGTTQPMTPIAEPILRAAKKIFDMSTLLEVSITGV